jgi:hypothetical protein
MWDAALGATTPVTINVPGSDLETAIVGLVGVLVGALISGFFNLGIAWRKERVDAIKERREHDVQVELAAQRIDIDLQIAESAARHCVERREWWHLDGPLRTEGWDQYQATIGPELTKSGKEAVVTAVMAVSAMQSSRDEATGVLRVEMALSSDPATKVLYQLHETHGTSPEPVSMADFEVEAMAGYLRIVEEGRATLARWAGD